ncbi:hypothetical protein E2542_SST05015 [Spatholobus suberectus]|nr:hypothetical protein E2542_SST05015 [Spatholobus suberectus]
MGQGLSVCSNETLMASIDNNSKMSTIKRLGAQAELKYKLFSARGHLRSELKGITYSDYKNLIHMASKEINLSLSFDPYHKLWLQVLQELHSMEDEFASKAFDLNSSVRSDHGISADGDGAVTPILIPNPHAATRVMNNSGEQNFRGLINQSGYVSGHANGSIFLFRDCKFP